MFLNLKQMRDSVRTETGKVVSACQYVQPVLIDNPFVHV